MPEKSAALYRRAAEKIPGGVNSPVRAWKAVGGAPLFVARGAGARLYDVDGGAYVDFVGSWGPLILGHAHPAILAAVERALRGGTSFGAPTGAEGELAEAVGGRFPPVEKPPLRSSGPQAPRSAG